MKLVYMGTPDFAVPSLEAIHQAGHEVIYVVTQPDAVRDRGKKIKLHFFTVNKPIIIHHKVFYPPICHFMEYM